MLAIVRVLWIYIYNIHRCYLIVVHCSSLIYFASLTNLMLLFVGVISKLHVGADMYTLYSLCRFHRRKGRLWFRMAGLKKQHAFCDIGLAGNEKTNLSLRGSKVVQGDRLTSASDIDCSDSDYYTIRLDNIRQEI